MESYPSLYLWFPQVAESDVNRQTITFLLSPFAGNNTFQADRDFSHYVIQRLHIEGEPTSWRSQLIRTSYFSEKKAIEAEKWVIAWRMSLTVDKEITELHPLKHEFMELSHGGGYLSVPVASTVVPAWCVIADFQSVVEAAAAGADISLREPAALISTYNLGKQLVQIRVECSPSSFGTDVSVNTIERICHEQGGITNQEEREDEWDMIFNDDGLE